MGTQRMSLLNRLCAIVNHEDPGSSNYALAEYLLQHYQELDKLNIYDLADACYSSRSSIRRFAQSIGYDNFKEMKDQFSQYEDWRAEHFMLAEGYDRHVQSAVQSVIDQICSRMGSSSRVRQLLHAIHDSPVPMFYCTGLSLALAQEFQREMVFNRKLVYASPDLDHCREMMENAEGEGLLIVITVSGGFARQSLAELDTIPAKKAIVLAADGAPFEGHFDLIYSFAAQGEYEAMSPDSAAAHMSLLGRYGATCFFDLLFWHYVRMFGD